MAKFNFNELAQKEAEAEQNRGDGLVYASKYLKDDGAQLIIRLPYTSVEEFDLATVHVVKMPDGKSRNVACLRGSHDPLDVCPLCNSGNTPKNKFYLKGITYVPNEMGQLQGPFPFVFERPAKFANKVASLLQEYPNLNQLPLKLIRRGKKGDTKTEYDLMVANAQMYTPEQYPYDFSVLNDIDVCKRSSMEKDANEMSTFIRTGAFPEKQQQPTVPQGTFVAPQYGGQPYVAPQPPVNQMPTYQAPQYNAPQPQTYQAPTVPPQQPMQQPVGGVGQVPPYQAPQQGVQQTQNIANGEADPYQRPKRIY